MPRDTDPTSESLDQDGPASGVSESSETSERGGQRRRVRGGGGRRRRVMMAAGVLAALLVGSAGVGAMLFRATPAERAAHLHQVALAHASVGEHREALPLYRRALEEQPAAVETRRALLRSLVRLQEFEQADAAATELLAYAPDDGFAHRHVAVRCMEAGDLRGAWNAALSASSDPAGYAAACRLLAELERIAGLTTASMKRWEQAAEADLDDPLACLQVGRFASVLAHLADDVALREKASVWFARAESRAAKAFLDQDDAEVKRRLRTLRVDAALRRGAFASARALLEELAPEDRPSLLDAAVCSAQGAHEAAEEILRRALAASAPSSAQSAASPNSDAAVPDRRNRRAVVHTQLVIALLAAGRVPEAAVELSALRTIAPDDPGVVMATRAVAVARHLHAQPDDLLAAVVLADPLVLVPSDAPILGPLLHPMDPTKGIPVQDVWSPAEPRATLRWNGEAALLRTGDDPVPSFEAGHDPIEADISLLLREDVHDPAAAYWKSVLALRRGEPRLAAGFADAAVTASPSSPEPRLVRALVHLARDRASDAVVEARAVVREFPAHEVAAVVLVKALLANGDAETAAQECDRARVNWPRSARVARVFEQLQTSDVASVSPVDSDRLVKARAELSRGDVARAVEIATPLLRNESEASEARALLTEAFDTTAAVHAQREEEFPDDPVVTIRRAQSLLLAGRARRAEAVLRAAAERQSSSTAAFALARLLVAVDRGGEALQILEHLEAQSPGDPQVALERGRVLIATNQTTEACQQFARALHPSADGQLGFVVQRRAALTLLLHAPTGSEHVERVERWIARLSVPDPGVATTDENAADRMAVVRGHLLRKRGDLEAAERVVREHLTTSPQDMEAHLLAAVLEAQAGQLDDAETRLVRALGRLPFHPPARRLLARVRIARGHALQRAGDSRAARAAYLHAIGLSGLSDADGQAVLGIVAATPPEERVATLTPLAVELSRDHPLRAAGPFLQAFVERHRGAATRCLAALQEAHVREPASSIVFATLIDALLRAGEHETARERCVARAAKPGGGVLAHMLLGHVLSANVVAADDPSGADRPFDAAEALKAYRTALEMRPLHWLARQRCAELLLASGEKDAALALLQEGARLIETDPATRPSGSSTRVHTIHANLALGSLLEEAGDDEGALQILRGAVARHPTYRARLTLARSLQAAGAFEEARVQIEAARVAQPGAPAAYFAWWDLLRRLDARGSDGSSVADLRRRMEVLADDSGTESGSEPSSEPSRPGRDARTQERAAAALLLGVMAEADKDWVRAERHLRSAIEVGGPDSLSFPVAANNLAWIVGTQLGRLDEALPLARRALDAAPESGTILDTMGRLLHLNGAHAEALLHLDRAVRARPKSAGPRLHRADARLALRQYERARDDYTHALRQDPARARRHGAPARLEELSARGRDGSPDPSRESDSPHTSDNADNAERTDDKGSPR